MVLNPADLHIGPNLATAQTLPSAWYQDPEALALEQQHIFRNSWQYAGAAGAVAQPGSYFTASVAGQPVVVLRDQGGVLRAFYNVCRHRAGPVARGQGKCRMLQCRYHGWTYALDGALQGTPEFAGVENFRRDQHGLVPVAVDTFGPLIFVHLGAAPLPLATILGTIPAEAHHLPLAAMALYHETTYKLNCNWKVYVDNYLEPYHLPQVHPGLTRELDYPAYKTDTFAHYSRQWAPVRQDKASLYRRGLAAGAQPEALYYWIFPNLMFNIYPDNLQINVIRPTDAGHTETYFAWFLLDPERPGRNAEFRSTLAFSDAIQQEDIEICEDVQKGLNSPAYDRGRYSVARENALHHFHELYARQMRAASAPSSA